jgi:hypothetical protein
MLYYGYFDLTQAIHLRVLIIYYYFYYFNISHLKHFYRYFIFKLDLDFENMAENYSLLLITQSFNLVVVEHDCFFKMVFNSNLYMTARNRFWFEFLDFKF